MASMRLIFIVVGVTVARMPLGHDVRESRDCICRVALFNALRDGWLARRRRLVSHFTAPQNEINSVTVIDTTSLQL